MAFRHKAVKSTLDQGTAAEWNDDHEQDFEVRVDHCEDIYTNAVADHWDLGQETSTTATTVSFSGGFVAIRQHAAGGAGNFSSMRHKILNAAADICDENSEPIVVMALDVQSPTADNATHEFGFFSNANALFAANQNGAFFRIDANVLKAVSSNGAAETETNLGAPDQFATYKVKHTATADYFYVDDMETPVATHTTTISAADLNIKMTCADRAAGDNYLNCQALWFSHLRQTA